MEFTIITNNLIHNKVVQASSS